MDSVFSLAYSEEELDAMRQSFLASQYYWEAASKTAKKELDEARLIVGTKEAAYSHTVTKMEQYANLFSRITGGGQHPSAEKLPSLVEQIVSKGGVATQQPSPSPTPDESEDDSVARRLRYPENPSIKLQELLAATPLAKTDEQLLDLLREAFNMPNIPLKTVQNKLLLMKAMKRIKRVRVSGGPEGSYFLNGLLDWFNGDKLKAEYSGDSFSNTSNESQLINEELGF